MHFCPQCGAPQPQPVCVWPHKCQKCGTEHFCSPKPVVAVILHAWPLDQGPMGIVAIRRGLSPYKGEWAFPGGYIDHAEDWRRAAAREVREELGIGLDPNQFYLRGEPVVTPTNYLVLFVQYTDEVLLTSAMTPSPQEVLDIRVLTKKDQDDPTFNMGVPSHQTTWKSLTFL